MEFNGKIVVVTGAGSGIGRACALEFARRGSTVIGCDLDGERLRSLAEEMDGAGLDFWSRIVDVSKAWQVEEFAAQVLREFGRVDILCNNAGVGVGGFFEAMSLDDIEWAINTNLMGVMNCCHYFYPRMIRQNEGHIVNICSGAVLSPIPLMSVYCATKGAVLAFSETLRSEAALHGVAVSAVCPGVVATNIIKSGRIRSLPGGISDSEMKKRVDWFFQKYGMPPERVAKAVIKALEKNRAVVPVRGEVIIGDFLHRLSRKAYSVFLELSVRVSLLGLKARRR